MDQQYKELERRVIAQTLPNGWKGVRLVRRSLGVGQTPAYYVGANSPANGYHPYATWRIHPETLETMHGHYFETQQEMEEDLIDRGM